MLHIVDEAARFVTDGDGSRFVYSNEASRFVYVGR